MYNAPLIHWMSVNKVMLTYIGIQTNTMCHKMDNSQVFMTHLITLYWTLEFLLCQLSTKEIMFNSNSCDIYVNKFASLNIDESRSRDEWFNVVDRYTVEVMTFYLSVKLLLATWLRIFLQGRLH